MKKLFACCIFCFASLIGFSQFLFFSVMPSPVGSAVFGDTLFNNAAILKREGIKKVIAVETSTQRREGASFTTTYVVNNGQIQTRSWCYRHAPDTAFRFCHFDTILYNNKGQLKEYKAMVGNGVAFMRNIIAYRDEGESLDTWIVFDPRKDAHDTSSSRRFYNKKGQLVRQLDNAKNFTPVNVDLFYNDDGLLDSVRHQNAAWGTYVFNRKRKGKKKEITLETPRLNYRWVYNEDGQCVSMNWTYSKAANRSKQSSRFTDISYFYNNDGTLKKVVENKVNYKVTTVYSYEK